MTDRNSIAAAYDEWAVTYDTDVNATRDLDGRVLRASGLDLAGRHVLEFGCGTGKNTGWLAEEARRVTAIDFSEGMLARARATAAAAHVLFVRHDLNDPLPFAGATFDLVVGNLVLEHVEHLDPVYGEAARVLRPGGALFFSELHPERQRLGGQAQFLAHPGQEPVYVPAFRHTVAEFMNGGIAAGLTLRHVGEWLEDGAPPGAAPRLLTVRFAKPG